MNDYLVFRLYGAMASWGQPAVGGDRATGAKPTRSALLGLLGAALGIQRDDAERLTALQRSVSVAIKQYTPGSLLRDYHTAQVPGTKKNRVHLTRKRELAEAGLHTVLSSRDYRCDGLWVVALTATENATYALADLHNALASPVYVLSLGRKSCPLGAPLAARLVSCETLKAALDTAFPPLLHSAQQDALWLGGNGWVTYYWEGDPAALGLAGVITHEPWDEPINRQRWQFRQHVLHQVSVQEASHVSV